MPLSVAAYLKLREQSSPASWVRSIGTPLKLINARILVAPVAPECLEALPVFLFIRHLP